MFIHCQSVCGADDGAIRSSATEMRQKRGHDDRGRPRSKSIARRSERRRYGVYTPSRRLRICVFVRPSFDLSSRLYEYEHEEDSKIVGFYRATLC